MVHAAILSTSAPVPPHAMVMKKTSVKKNAALKMVKNGKKVPAAKPASDRQTIQ